MNEGIKDIQLMLENYETIVIPRNMIGQIVIKDFKESLRRRAINSIIFMKTSYYVILQIKDANQIYHDSEESVFEYDDEITSLLEKLKYNNITNILINYEDSAKNYNWFVGWESVDEKTNLQNKLQTTQEVFNDIWIAIGENAQKELELYLPHSQEERDSDWKFMK